MSPGKPLTQEAQLLLYALEQQASLGPCKAPKPGGWGWGSAEDIAKWESWRHLGQMNGMEAMRLYVRSVEEEQPDWYSMLLKVLSMQQEGAGDGEAPPGAAGVFNLHRGRGGFPHCGVLGGSVRELSCPPLHLLF